MQELWEYWEFWVAVLFAVLVKYKASPTLGIVSAVLSTLVAITGALVFTEPVVEILKLSGDNWRFAIAALVALTCEHMGRILLELSLDDIKDFFRGRNK